ncbi:Vta1 domain-containing protein [Abeliophyllum distichum]|uniref:Vta1 domain-containing protein n=1 Tax=Abeliophyllum distichum TaxID=126358 RepID=A0ABD1PUA6_9LAMI
MDANLYGSEQASPNRLTKHGADDKNGSLKPLVMNFIKTRCLWAAMKISKKQFHGQEKQQQQQELHSKNTRKVSNTVQYHPIQPISKVVTLEDWILSSPDFNRSCTSGGYLRDTSLKGSLMKFMKPRQLWAAMKIRKKQFHGQENQQQLLKNTCKVVTLEEWILSSPGFSTSTNEGNLLVSKQSSNRIHPSVDGEYENIVPNSRASSCVEIDKDERGQSANTSLCRNKSRKLKKKGKL